MINRRDLLKGLGVVAGVSAVPVGRAFAEGAPNDPRFLIVLSATGGASLIDSFLAIRASESRQASRLNCFPDAMVQNIVGSPFRAVDHASSSIGPIPISFRANQSAFIAKHKSDIMVATHTATSVNHAIAQKRAITGNEAFRGRTLQELVALQHGGEYAIPNVVMATGTAYIAPGTDPTLPERCYGEPVAAPVLWPLGLHGSKGIDAPRADLIAKARRLRDERLDVDSRFARVFARSKKLDIWKKRRAAQPLLEASDLISTLMMQPNSAAYPLEAHGLKTSADGARVREKFPDFDTDPLEAQAALAFLLIKNRVSVSVTIGPDFGAVIDDDVNIDIYGSSGGVAVPEGALKNPPLSFDFSHQAHRDAQAVMWNRTFKVIDGLVDLLKGVEFASGESFWDRSMIYLATDFGRSKDRPENATTWSSSHDLNNGAVVISPLANGNRVLGGVDKDTGLTFGFDPETGEPRPSSTMEERQIFAGILHALGVDTSGANLPDMRAMRKRA